MNQSKELPPNFADITAVLPVTEASSMIFTYGDTIYNVKEPLSFHTLAHEEVHKEQQGDNPAGWWTKYLSDPGFRQEQEIAAYAKQYRAVDAFKTEVRDNLLDQCASFLSDPVYGLDLSFGEARSKIRNKSKSL